MYRYCFVLPEGCLVFSTEIVRLFEGSVKPERLINTDPVCIICIHF